MNRAPDLSVGRNAEDGWVRLPDDDYKNGLPEAFYKYAPLSLRIDPNWDDYHAGARDMLTILRQLSTERSD